MMKVGDGLEWNLSAIFEYPFYLTEHNGSWKKQFLFSAMMLIMTLNIKQTQISKENNITQSRRKRSIRWVQKSALH